MTIIVFIQWCSKMCSIQTGRRRWGEEGEGGIEKQVNDFSVTNFYVSSSKVETFFPTTFIYSKKLRPPTGVTSKLILF